ncbi:MAG: arylsulfatase [Candidatus Sumerlaeota bacterium]|nr:arylsulfatase [Candidatus Sumerlaeota bacterium]
MNRRDFLRWGGAGLAGLALPRAALSAGVNAATRPAGAAPARPNIVLMMADDMGYSDLGCYGGEIHTPNLDGLARQGVRFSQFYNNAKCVPTRASLLTGLYSQQVGEGAMRNAVTIAEALRPAGYRTLMVGKWHASGSIPVERGFDRSYGLVAGCCNYFNPGERRAGEPEPGRKARDGVLKWAIDDQVLQPYTPEDRKFYTTDAFTDNAVNYLDQYGRDGKPFFLYVAFNAPHYPLHAWPEDIARYRGKYKDGPDPVRKARLKRQIAMGVIDQRWALSPRDAQSPDWSTLDEARQDDEDLRMSIYAAQIDRMDQGVGRILAKIKELGVEDNTLVMFLSDNGGTSEGGPFGFNLAEGVKPGGIESYASYGLCWGNASNTPFRKYKTYDHEGGISTPFIARWPAVIRQGGGITPQVGHIIDVMATCVDVAGAEHPSTYEGRDVLPLEGISLRPIFEGKTRKGHSEIFWQFGSNRAVRQGKWKLVSTGSGPWELYDMEADRTEQHDLSKEEPEKASELAALWEAWAKRVGAKIGTARKGKTKQAKPKAGK